MQIILHKNEKYFDKQGKECESQCIYLQGEAFEFSAFWKRALLPLLLFITSESVAMRQQVTLLHCPNFIVKDVSKVLSVCNGS